MSFEAIIVIALVVLVSTGIEVISKLEQRVAELERTVQGDEL